MEEHIEYIFWPASSVLAKMLNSALGLRHIIVKMQDARFQ